MKNDNNQQIPVGKSIKGSAIYGQDGTCIFTPYAESKPENATWLPLVTVKYGKLECSKNKVRVVMTMNRADLTLVNSTFTKAFGQIVGKTSDKKVQKMYKAAANSKPCEIRETHPFPPCEGGGASQADDAEYPMFP